LNSTYPLQELSNRINAGLAAEADLIQLMEIMTAHEVIDQIKALPPEERAKVAGFIHEMESSLPAGTMDEKTFEHSARIVFDRHAELMKKLSK
jgi:hypothetical protein